MDWIINIVGFVVHIDKHLVTIIQNFGTGSYLVLFAIVFCETGLVVTPFLPGDSLLFAAGALAAVGSFKVHYLFFTLFAAAVIGDNTNYAIGKLLGDKVFKTHPRIFKKEYLDKTHQFYEKYGGKTVVIAQFVPIVRTMAPFVAGVGAMTYPRFLIYNLIGTLSWVSIFVFGGYFFGNVPFVKNNFSLTILAIIVISLLPGVIEVWKHKRAAKLAKP